MYHMGVDVGSVSTDIVILDKNDNLVEGLYLKTMGNPIKILGEGFKKLGKKYKDEDVLSIGITGSGRKFASFFIGGDAVKNEITAHAVASLELDPKVRTIIEIGGQDSKIITLQNGIINDFAMNTVCAAGTGSFLDRQAERMGISIGELGNLALKGKGDVRIAGRCAVFAESDMIHKQQIGCTREDILRGLCKALVRNYLSNVGKGKDIKEKIFFQGGVASNEGIKRAFEETLACEIYVPKNHKLMGAIGASNLGKSEVLKNGGTKFKGFNFWKDNFKTETYNCNNCANCCEVIKILSSGKVIGFFGDRCNKWSNKIMTKAI